ncbi:hypothetical protein ACHMW9_17960 [Mesorhizobium terrae]
MATLAAPFASTGAAAVVAAAETELATGGNGWAETGCRLERETEARE